MSLLKRPEVLGGVTLGVLSALPVVGAFNCCCAWILLGGAVAAQQQQEQQPLPISNSEGADVGFRAGVLGALIWVVLSWPIGLLLRPVIQRYVERALESRDLPPEVQNLLASMGTGSETPWAMVFVGNLLLLMVCALVAALGGLFGAMYFRKPEPPPPPPIPINYWAPPPLPPLDPPPAAPER